MFVAKIGVLKIEKNRSSKWFKTIFVELTSRKIFFVVVDSDKNIFFIYVECKQYKHFDWRNTEETA